MKKILMPESLISLARNILFTEQKVELFLVIDVSVKKYHGNKGILV
jgi:hypothetical protein